MSLDLHSNVKIKEIELAEIDGDGYTFFRVVYRIKRGRKDYKIWVLPEDLRECGIFPLSYRRMTKYADALDMHNNVIFTGSHSECRRFVQCANQRYYNSEIS